MRTSTGVPRTYVDGTQLWIDSRSRAVAQWRFEAAVLHRLGGDVRGGEVLELGAPDGGGPACV
ncbi:MAG: hypothetical protein M3Q22_17055 [Actinomycetota bacterium]|nr:hypothetical protein [Actinomycetota bacterium]